MMLQVKLSNQLKTHKNDTNKIIGKNSDRLNIIGTFTLIYMDNSYIKDLRYSPLIMGKKELMYNDIIFKLEK